MCVIGTLAFCQEKKIKGKVTVIQHDSISKHIYEYNKNFKKEKKIKVYRIQLFNGDRKNALSMKSNFLSLFPQEKHVDIIFESPEFKILIGIFKTRLEAEKYHKNIKRAFSNSFVTVSKILIDTIDEIESSNKKNQKLSQ
ncbi:sporulation-like protein [Ichthyobacterium seriolicida]|uniref:Sporulation-like protein n=2 Tax=Ichthyobacterium seriolicida TaxID=242600 RepID=A0A1J1DZN7_9FLAO|nr:sporulation-like protein [Ichthyobacterium seriolicida]